MYSFFALLLLSFFVSCSALQEKTEGPESAQNNTYSPINMTNPMASNKNFGINSSDRQRVYDHLKKTLSASGDLKGNFVQAMTQVRDFPFHSKEVINLIKNSKYSQRLYLNMGQVHSIVNLIFTHPNIGKATIVFRRKLLELLHELEQRQGRH